MKKGRILSLLLSAAVSVSCLAAGAAVSWAQPAGNPDGVFLKEESSGTCTLASATMMLRQKSLNEGNSTWKNITQKSVRAYGWVEGVGIRMSFTYYGIKVKRVDFGADTDRRAEILSLLAEHPEGIEIYDRAVPHAVLLTRYDAEEDVFYCADPGLSDQEMALGDSWMRKVFSGAGQEDIISGIDNVWIITSYELMAIPDEKKAEADSSEVEEPEITEPVEDVVREVFPKVRDYEDADFEDVVKSEWYVSYVESVYESGLMSGVSSGTFCPEQEVTLAQAITMAARINSRFADDGKVFQVITGTDWVRPYLDYAVGNGLITDELANSEYLDSPVSRAQFAQIISAAVPEDACKAINTIKSGQFPDIRESGAAGKAVYRLCRAGIITGDSKGNFDPEGSLTRAQMAAVAARITDPELRVKL
ncbi:MAG: S-layer homology domain-containing protein [Anaerovoracaceae bacterium]